MAAGITVQVFRATTSGTSPGKEDKTLGLQESFGMVHYSTSVDVGGHCGFVRINESGAVVVDGTKARGLKAALDVLRRWVAGIKGGAKSYTGDNIHSLITLIGTEVDKADPATLNSHKNELLELLKRFHDGELLDEDPSKKIKRGYFHPKNEAGRNDHIRLINLMRKLGLSDEEYLVMTRDLIPVGKDEISFFSVVKKMKEYKCSSADIFKYLKHVASGSEDEKIAKAVIEMQRCMGLTEIASALRNAGLLISEVHKALAEIKVLSSGDSLEDLHRVNLSEGKVLLLLIDGGFGVREVYKFLASLNKGRRVPVILFARMLWKGGCREDAIRTHVAGLYDEDELKDINMNEIIARATEDRRGFYSHEDFELFRAEHNAAVAAFESRDVNNPRYDDADEAVRSELKNKKLCNDMSRAAFGRKRDGDDGYVYGTYATARVAFAEAGGDPSRDEFPGEFLGHTGMSGEEKPFVSGVVVCSAADERDNKEPKPDAPKVLKTGDAGKTVGKNVSFEPEEDDPDLAKLAKFVRKHLPKNTHKSLQEQQRAAEDFVRLMHICGFHEIGDAQVAMLFEEIKSRCVLKLESGKPVPLSDEQIEKAIHIRFPKFSLLEMKKLEGEAAPVAVAVAMPPAPPPQRNTLKKEDIVTRVEELRSKMNRASEIIQNLGIDKDTSVDVLQETVKALRQFGVNSSDIVAALHKNNVELDKLILACVSSGAVQLSILVRKLYSSHRVFAKDIVMGLWISRVSLKDITFALSVIDVKLHGVIDALSNHGDVGIKDIMKELLNFYGVIDKNNIIKMLATLSDASDKVKLEEILPFMLLKTTITQWRLSQKEVIILLLASKYQLKDIIKVLSQNCKYEPDAIIRLLKSSSIYDADIEKAINDCDAGLMVLMRSAFESVVTSEMAAAASPQATTPPSSRARGASQAAAGTPPSGRARSDSVLSTATTASARNKFVSFFRGETAGVVPY